MGNAVAFAEISRAAQLRVIWGFLWRGLLLSLASLIVSMIIGFIVGFVAAIGLSVAGLEVEEYTFILRVVGFFLGLAVGLCFSVLYVVWMFASRLGSFRLALVDCRAVGSIGTSNPREAV